MPDNTIEVNDQPRLGLRRTVRLTVNGIRYRLFRSAVTVAVIAVAIAFLMNSLTEGLVRRAVARDTAAQIDELHRATRWAARLQTPGTDQEIIAAIAAQQGLLAPAAAGSEAEGLTALAGRSLELTRFLSGLTYGYRRQLVRHHTGLPVLDYLRSADGRSHFDTAVKTNRRIRFPWTATQLDSFLAAWPRLKAAVAAERRARAAAIARLRPALNGRAPMGALTDAGGEFGDRLRDVGFELPPAEATAIAGLAHESADRQVLESTMAEMPVKQRVAARFDLLPTDVTPSALWQRLLTPDFGEWYAALCTELELELPLAPARLTELAVSQRFRSRLLRAERLGAGVGEGPLGLGERMSWLLFVSLLVCGVGIANAMLMSVTERFKEIATIKCLGALDGFIMLMFVLEAIVFGLIGGLVGAFLGILIGWGRMLALYGSQALTAGGYADLAGATVLAVATGIILAIVSAAYPSFKAARLPPMEAMRIE